VGRGEGEDGEKGKGKVGQKGREAYVVEVFELLSLGVVVLVV